MTTGIDRSDAIASIILTRAEADNVRTAEALGGLGVAIHAAPMIELRAIEHGRAHLEMLATMVRGATAMLTSAHATRRWLELRRTVFADDAPRSYLVVGVTSARMLAEDDPTVPVVAVAPTAAALVEHLPTSVEQIFYPCSAKRRDEAIELLRARGVAIVELPLYEPVMPSDARERLDDALERSTPPRAILFFSPSAVSNWFSLRSDIPPDSIFVAIGPTTAESLRAHGVEEIVTADGPDAAALAGTIHRSLRDIA